MKEIMRCLGVYDWDARVHCADVFDVMRKHFSEEKYSLVDFSLLVSSWPRAKRLDVSSVQDVIRGRDDIKSIEGHFEHQKYGRAYFLISGSASPASVILVQMPRRPETENSLERLVRLLASLCSLGYGYIFDWVGSSDPAFHALGITHQNVEGNDEDEEQEDSDERWFNERVLKPPLGRRYLDSGMFRDIYEINILNTSHLNRIAERLGVEAFQSEGWGTLTALPNGTWLWNMEMHDRSKVAAQLKGKGLLI